MRLYSIRWIIMWLHKSMKKHMHCHKMSTILEGMCLQNHVSVKFYSKIIRRSQKMSLSSAK